VKRPWLIDADNELQGLNDGADCIDEEMDVSERRMPCCVELSCVVMEKEEKQQQ
jgi:hypothetical protein